MSIIGKTAKGTASLFVFLTGRTNLKNTKAHLSESKRLLAAYKDTVVKDRESLSASVDELAYNRDEFAKRFGNLRVVTGLMIIPVFAYFYYMSTSTHLFDLVCRFITAILFFYLYLALSRYLVKLRLAYTVLPKKITEEEGSVTWARFATMVADRPSLLLPVKLDR